jgi:membrane dipeptidase
VRKLVVIPALLLLAVLIVFFLAVPTLVDGHLNQTRPGGPYAVSARALALHARLLVADLHADSLVWGRDLLARGTRGHLDVPRLIEGGVALQVFDVFTKTPWNLNIDRTEDKGDAVTLLALTQGWAPKTWTSLKERAVYQARRLHRMAALSGGRLRVVKRGADLASYLERRARDPGIVAGLLALEGGQVLEGEARNVAVMDQAGYRMIGLAHFFDNDVA